MNTQEIDVRRGATSASNANADILCQGRHLAQKGIKSQPSEYAEFGTLIHKALANSADKAILNSLDAEQRDIFDACREIEKSCIEQFFGSDTTPKRVFREQRYWVMVDKKWEHSGQPDVVVRAGPKGLVLEYKTLPGDVPDSPTNLQLRDQVVLAAGSLMLTEVGVAIIQPLVTHRPTIATYQRVHIEQAIKDMFARVRASNDPSSKRTPGDLQCKFCLAKSTCPEYQKFAGELVVAKSQMDAKYDILDKPVQEWTPQMMDVFLDRRDIAKKWIAECEDFIKELLKREPDSVPGWGLKPGKNRRTINNPTELFNRFIQLIPDKSKAQEAFLSCIKVMNEAFELQVRLASGLKGKELQSKVKELTAGILEVNQDEPSLTRIKPQSK